MVLAVIGVAQSWGQAAVRLPHSTPEAQGISSAAILELIDAVDTPAESFRLVRHGRVVAESWWASFAAETPHPQARRVAILA